MPTTSHLLESTIKKFAELELMFHRKSIQDEYALLAITTHAEVYVDHALRALIDESLDDRSPFILALYASQENTIFGTWASRMDWLKTGFGVSLSNVSVRQEFDALVQLRNAIMHGAGHLTPRQSDKVSKMIEHEKSLKRVLGCSVEAGLVRPTQNSVHMAFRVARNFVVELDDTVRTIHPSLIF